MKILVTGGLGFIGSHTVDALLAEGATVRVLDDLSAGKRENLATHPRLELIVGDIRDEHDVPVAGVRPQTDGSYLIDGAVTLRDLNREFDWGLPDDQATTLAGLILYEARTIPEAGQRFLFHGFRFEILRRQRELSAQEQGARTVGVVERRAQPRRA